MAFKSARYVTLVAATERVVDLVDSSGWLFPQTITILNRGGTGGPFEIAVAIERVAGTLDVDEESATLPLTACPTDGAYLSPAVKGDRMVIAVGAKQDGADLKVHLYSTGTADVGIIAEGD